MEQVVLTCGGNDAGAQCGEPPAGSEQALLRQHQVLVQTLRGRLTIAVCSSIHDRRVWCVECCGAALKGLAGNAVVFGGIHAALAYALEVVKPFDLDRRARASCGVPA